MTDGEKIREARERLGLSQAAVAAAVGASQQSVDRIENNGVTHSRYTTPILSWLEARGREAGMGQALDLRSDELLALRTGSFVDGFVLEGGLLVPSDPVRAPDLLGKEEGLFAVTLGRGFQGPMGDVVYRPGDRLFLSPTPAPRHFDICLVRPRDSRSSKSELRYVLDRIETPGAMDAISDHYVWSDADDVSFSKVMAVFSR